MKRGTLFLIGTAALVAALTIMARRSPRIANRPQAGAGLNGANEPPPRPLAPSRPRTFLDVIGEQ